MKEVPLKLEVLKNITDRSQLGELSQAIIACITNSFGHEMPEDEVNHALRGELMVLARTVDNHVVGFATLVRKSSKNSSPDQLDKVGASAPQFLLAAGTVNQNFQGLGIYRKLNKERLGYVIWHKAALISTATQNPRVENGISQVLDEFVQTGKLTAYKVKRVKLPAFFGRRLTECPLKTEGTPFSDLDIDKGDAFSLVFNLKYPSS